MALDGPVDGPDLILNINIKLRDVLNIALDGPVNGPDLNININIKSCDVLCKIVLCFKYCFGRTCGRTC